MPLLQKLKSMLGLGGADRDPGERRDVGVTVEREAGEPAAATTESAGTTTPTPEVAGEASTAAPASTDSPADPATEAAADSEAAAAEEEPDDGAAESAETTVDETGDAGAEDGADLEEIDGVGPAYAGRLRDAGVTSIAALAEVDPEEIAEDVDLSPNRIGDWVEQARER